MGTDTAVMRKLAVWLLLQALIVVSDVNGFSLSELISVLHPLSISTSNSAQQFEGWGTSLAWFAEYVGGLAGDDMTRLPFSIRPGSLSSCEVNRDMWIKLVTCRLAARHSGGSSV